MTDILSMYLNDLNSSEWWIRNRAVEGLAALRDIRALAALIKALGDESDVVRHHAAKGLGELGDQSAIGPLSNALRRENDRDAAYAIIDALNTLGIKGVVAVNIYYLQEQRNILFSTATKNFDHRIKIIRKLGELKAVEAIPILSHELQHKDIQVRKNACSALADIGDKSAVEPLIQALQDEYFAVRRRAAQALGELKDEKATEFLIKALRDVDNTVREDAARALERLGTPEALTALNLWQDSK